MNQWICLDQILEYNKFAILVIPKVYHADSRICANASYKTFVMQCEIKDSQSNISFRPDEVFPCNQSMASLFLTIFPPEAMSDIFVDMFHDSSWYCESAYEECGQIGELRFDECEFIPSR